MNEPQHMTGVPLQSGSPLAPVGPRRAPLSLESLERASRRRPDTVRSPSREPPEDPWRAASVVAGRHHPDKPLDGDVRFQRRPSDVAGGIHVEAPVARDFIEVVDAVHADELRRRVGVDRILRIVRLEVGADLVTRHGQADLPVAAGTQTGGGESSAVAEWVTVTDGRT